MHTRVDVFPEVIERGAKQNKTPEWTERGGKGEGEGGMEGGREEGDNWQKSMPDDRMSEK